MLKLTLIGNLGADAEIRDVNTSKVITFSVAHTEKIKGEDKTTWVRCNYWRNQGDSTAVSEYLKKGTQVYVEGVPSMNIYTKQDGTTGVSFECRVSVIQLLGNRPSVLSDTSTTNSYSTPSKTNSPTDDFPPADDDLPF
ncbi:MAG: single-stranded DNA-binding protein [Bacteroidia bacterium]|nr:single-stranded DNA-binding protein [Bacteroidia bacterium]